MEHQRANVSHWMRGQKVHNFILNSLQFSESFQKHTVVWIFLQLVLTRHKIEKKGKNRKERKKCENSHNSLFQRSLKKVLCSTNVSTLSYCSYGLRFWLRDHSYVICLWLAYHSTVRCLSLAEKPLVKRLWFAGCKWLAEQWLYSTNDLLNSSPNGTNDWLIAYLHCAYDWLNTVQVCRPILYKVLKFLQNKK